MAYILLLYILDFQAHYIHFMRTQHTYLYSQAVFHPSTNKNLVNMKVFYDIQLYTFIHSFSVEIRIYISNVMCHICLV